MKVVETQVFTFDELSQQSKEVALENHREANTGFDDWYQPIFEGFLETLPELGFDVDQIMFSGFWSQGDGAMFTYMFNDNILKNFIEQLVIDDQQKSLIKLSATVSGKGTHSGHYYHSGCCSHQIYIESIAPYEDETVELIDNLQDVFEQYVIDLYDEQCDKIYSALEKYYYELENDENVAEFLLANDLEFTQDGQDYLG